jgi:hypothetical protein
MNTVNCTTCGYLIWKRDVTRGGNCLRCEIKRLRNEIRRLRDDNDELKNMLNSCDAARPSVNKAFDFDEVFGLD